MQFYRVVKSTNPTRDDFLSWVEKGKAIPSGTPKEEVANYHAVSMHESQLAAERKSRRMPRLGGLVVRVDIPSGGHITWAQTGSDPTHYDIYGSTADELLSLAVPPAIRVT